LVGIYEIDRYVYVHVTLVTSVKFWNGQRFTLT